MSKETQRQMNEPGGVYAQVHRFSDCVAAYLGQGATVYLTPKEARQFARALSRAAKSCESEPFSASKVGTAQFYFST